MNEAAWSSGVYAEQLPRVGFHYANLSFRITASFTRAHFKYVYLYTNTQGATLPLSNFDGGTGLLSLGLQSFARFNVSTQLSLPTEKLILPIRKKVEEKRRCDSRHSWKSMGSYRIIAHEDMAVLNQVHLIFSNW